jgi:hypothetical protein
MGQGKSGRHFIGTCSKCRKKKTTVVKFKNGQICINDCLPAAINRLGAGPAAFTVSQPSQPIVVGGFADPASLGEGDNPIMPDAPAVKEGM